MIKEGGDVVPELIFNGLQILSPSPVEQRLVVADVHFPHCVFRFNLVDGQYFLEQRLITDDLHDSCKSLPFTLGSPESLDEHEHH